MARGVLSLSFGLALVASLSLSLSQLGCDQLDEFFNGTPGGGAADRPCASTAACPTGTTCTTEAGVCNPPPGCDPAKGVCPAVCYGTCAPRAPSTTTCRTNADCRLFSDYCTGCDCRALPNGAPDPTCSGPGVQCFVDPCDGKTAVCTRGACAVSGP
jgi:hypothetical protein